MDLRKLKTMIELVQQSGIAELEVTEGEERVRIVRGGQATTADLTHVVTPVLATPAAAPVALPPAAAADPAGAAPPPPGHVLKSPMVGTFYRSPSPGGKVFVEVGDTVKAGQTICIIEAMKLMNEIECDRDGEIAAVYVENGQPVQFGDRLFAIKLA